MKKLFLALSVLFFSFTAFAQRVISPAEGNYSNRQLLVLNLKAGEEAFYSCSDTHVISDPLTSGFAYDGPVLLDYAGRVTLRVVVMAEPTEDNPEGIEKYEIKYNVSAEENPFGEYSEEYAFVDRIHRERIIECNGLKDLTIPETLQFSLGNGERPFIKGKTLSISAENNLYRYIPCTVTDGKNRWRFIINLNNGRRFEFPPEVEVPFKITDWYTFNFTGKNLIWTIDDDIWSASTEPVFIDRSTSHKISWQSVAYEIGNPVETFILPAKPQLVKEYSERKAVFTVLGDSDYRLKVVSGGAEYENHDNDGQYRRVVFDIFEGDSLDGNAEFALYANGVYQGSLWSEYKIDKRPPLAPVFDSGDSGFYARSDVRLKIKAEDDADIYYAVSGPVELSDGTYNEQSPEFDLVTAENFEPYSSDELSFLLLKAKKRSAVFYKVVSYAVDKAGNRSSDSEYRLIIDDFNYFIDSGSWSEKPDGSRNKPFYNIQQVLSVIDSSDYSHFYVIGDFNIDRNGVKIKSNCAFTGNSAARITVAPNASLCIEGAGVVFSNIYFSKTHFDRQETNAEMLIIEDSAVSFNDCQFNVNFSHSGTGLRIEKSSVRFNECTLAVQAGAYACGLSLLNSEIVFVKGSLVASSVTSVSMSLTDSTIEARDSRCEVSGQLGRLLESTASHLKFSDCTLISNLKKKKRGESPVYKDEKTLVLEYLNNIEEGF